MTNKLAIFVVTGIPIKKLSFNLKSTDNLKYLPPIKVIKSKNFDNTIAWNLKDPPLNNGVTLSRYRLANHEDKPKQ